MVILVTELVTELLRLRILNKVCWSRDRILLKFDHNLSCFIHGVNFEKVTLKTL